jgi:hypothetical protein
VCVVDLSDVANQIHLVPNPRVGRAKGVLVVDDTMNASSLCKQHCKIVSISISPSKAYEFGDKEMRLGQSAILTNGNAVEGPVDRVVHVAVALETIHLNYS